MTFQNLKTLGKDQKLCEVGIITLLYTEVWVKKNCIKVEYNHQCHVQQTMLDGKQYFLIWNSMKKKTAVFLLVPAQKSSLKI